MTFDILQDPLIPLFFEEKRGWRKSGKVHWGLERWNRDLVDETRVIEKPPKSFSSKPKTVVRRWVPHTHTRTDRPRLSLDLLFVSQHTGHKGDNNQFQQRNSSNPYVWQWDIKFQLKTSKCKWKIIENKTEEKKIEGDDTRFSILWAKTLPYEGRGEEYIFLFEGVWNHIRHLHPSRGGYIRRFYVRREK